MGLLSSLFGKPKVDTSAADMIRDDAEAARKADEARQAQINKGLAAIKAMFEGGSYETGRKLIPNEGYTRVKPMHTPKVYTGGANNGADGAGALMPNGNMRPEDVSTLTAPGYVSGNDPTGQVGALMPNGNDPTGQGGGVPAATPAAAWLPFSVGDKMFGSRGHAQAYADKQNRENSSWRVSRSENYGGVNPLLADRRQTLQDFYLPALDEQRIDADETLGLSLARAGLARSTVATRRKSDLNNDFTTQRAGIMSNIEGDVAQTRSALADQRSQIEAMLRSTGDVNAATSGALSRISNMAQSTPTMSPLGDVFAGVGAGIGGYQAGVQQGQIQREVDSLRRYLKPARSGEVK